MVKEIVGIYADEVSVHYHCVKKILHRYTPCVSPFSMGTSGEIKPGGPAGLKEFLKQIPPHFRRKIYLTLPRSMFFVREIILPQLSSEDALDAVENSIGLYSHLPLPEIYYDIFITPEYQNGTHCLLIYALKKQVDPFKIIFQDTGHAKSLAAIFPISHGICAWIQIHKPLFPAGVIHSDRDTCELMVLDKRSWLTSVTWDAGDDSSGIMALTNILSNFPGVASKLYHTESEYSASALALDSYASYKITSIDEIGKNLAIAAVAPAMCKIQQISLDGSSVKIHVVKPFRYVALIFCILFLLMFYVTDVLKNDVRLAHHKTAKMKTHVSQLKARIKPLQQKIQLLVLAEKAKEDADLFVHNRPRLYTSVNEIARLAPEGTWFPHFDYRGGKINLGGLSDNASLVMERFRTSKLFSKIRLKGSVSIARKGSERFRVELTIERKKESP